MRRGYLSPRDHTLLKGLRRELELDEGMKPVHLLVTYKVTFAKKLMVVYRESWMWITSIGKNLGLVKDQPHFTLPRIHLEIQLLVFELDERKPPRC